MDDKLKQVLDFANYRQTLNNQLQKSKIKTEGALLFSKNGGSFIVGPEFILFLDFLSKTDLPEYVILDKNNIPIKIEDPSKLLKEVLLRYTEVTSSYYKEYQEIKNSRSVKSILKLEE